VSGQLSHQQKHGFNLQQQCSQCGSFSWQQPLQSVQVSQPQPQPLLQELHEVDAPQLGEVAALQLDSAAGAAALLQLPLSEAEAEPAVAGAGAGAVGAAGAACAEAL
jgi:hypothetical protein